MLRRRLAPLAVLIGLLAWIAGVTAGQVHVYLETHYVCAEHGEVVDAAHDGAQTATDQVRSGDAGAHDHCSLHGVALSALPNLALTLPADALLAAREPRLPGAGAPRAPPLAYAPKTSPPVPA